MPTSPFDIAQDLSQNPFANQPQDDKTPAHQSQPLSFDFSKYQQTATPHLYPLLTNTIYIGMLKASLDKVGTPYQIFEWDNLTGIYKSATETLDLESITFDPDLFSHPSFSQYFIDLHTIHHDFRPNILKCNFNTATMVEFYLNVDVEPTKDAALKKAFDLSREKELKIMRQEMRSFGYALEDIPPATYEDGKTLLERIAEDESGGNYAS